jgi:hypothetical protein
VSEVRLNALVAFFCSFVLLVECQNEGTHYEDDIGANEGKQTLDGVVD